MKLYYSPGICSMSPHIVLCEAGVPYTLERVDIKAHVTENGADYYKINEKGAVPYLIMDNGEGLSEGVAIVQYIADQKPDSGLAPKNGTLERVRLQEWLNYISTEVHKAHGPIFYAEKTGEQAKGFYLQKVKNAYDYVSSKLKGKKYLMGDQFTVADAYLFTVLGWHKPIGLDLSAWPALADYHARIAARPAVQAAMKAEGLLDKAAA